MVGLTEDEWFEIFEPINDIILLDIKLSDKMIRFVLILAINEIPFIKIEISENNRSNIIQKYRINLLTLKQYGYRDETDIDPSTIEFLDWLIHTTSEFLGNEIFYEPYMEPNKPSDTGIFDFSKPIWYNIIYWINNIEEEQFIDPNTPIPNLLELI